MASTEDRSSGGSVGGSDMEEMPTASPVVHEIMELIRSEDEECRVRAAREIRRQTKTSPKHRQQLAGAVEPLVSMLRSRREESMEAAILALLNLAVKDERNKIKIIAAGALETLVELLQSTNTTLQEYATAAILTLSTSSMNRPVISSAGAIPFLIKVLQHGKIQAKVDAVKALCNLSTIKDNLKRILSFRPIPSLINLLKSCKKSSKPAEKCTALLGSLMELEEGRIALTMEEGGVLTVVVVLEEGSSQSREHAVGALLTMCQSDRCKYRQVILKEGAIPGLLQLTIQGTPKSQAKARLLLELLRDSPRKRSELQTGTIENIVTNIVSKIDDGDRADKAKKMLAEMVQVSMEQSLRHLQQRALVCTPSEVSSK